MWTLILTFHMGHMPLAGMPLLDGDSLQVQASAVGYPNSKACELAGTLVKEYFSAKATPDNPNGDGWIAYSCIKAK
jgi:hypothetical protein